MKLEWFRKHKQFVYWVLLPVVGLGTAFFGVSNLFRSDNFLRSVGPSVRYTVAGETYTMDPSQVFELRQMLARMRHANNVSSSSAAVHEVEYHTALAAGMEIGPREMQDRLIESAKNQLQWYERGEHEETSPKITEEVYHKLLDQMQLTDAQYERIARETLLADNLQMFISGYGNEDAQVSDAQLFLAFQQEKEVVRLRYKEISSKDFMSKTQEPAADKVKAFYDNNQDLSKISEDLKDLLVTKPKISAEILYYDPTKLLADLKPAEDDLKKYYEENKKRFWKETPPETPAGGAEPPETFKPFDTVKADVETKWRDSQKWSKPQDQLTKLKTDLAAAEKAWAEAGTPEEKKSRKPFDLAAWAEKNGLKYWVTDELTEAAFKDGKKEVGAKDAGWAARIFDLIRPAKDSWSQTAEQRKKTEEFINKMHQKQLTEFGAPEIVENAKPEKGWVIARKKNFVPEHLKNFADVKADIVTYLRQQDAVELAKKEAQRIHDDWAKGTTPPPLDSLEEIAADSTSKDPLAELYFKAPKAVGEILDVASGPAKADKPNEAGAHQDFYIGLAVQRQFPTWTTFHSDTKWDREKARTKIANADIYAVWMAFQEQVHAEGRVFGSEDPPLFDSLRHGHSSDED